MNFWLWLYIWIFEFLIVAHENFQHFPKSCVSGQNGKSHNGKTVEECSALCLDNPNCLAFEYYVDYGGSLNSRDEGFCSEQSGSDKTGCNGVDWNYDLYVKNGLL